VREKRRTGRDWVERKGRDETRQRPLRVVRGDLEIDVDSLCPGEGVARAGSLKVEDDLLVDESEG
jgi:hypothetical protein